MFPRPAHSNTGPLQALDRTERNRPMRSEHTIFADLATLCVSPGYIHAAATLCYRDNVVGFAKELTPDDLAQLLDPTRLSRAELTTLIGLMMRSPIDFSLPASHVLSDYIRQSEVLLKELHDALLPSALKKGAFASDASLDASGPEPSADALREAIFYCSESAYPSQYRDLASKKYRADSEWLLRNKSFDVQIGREVCLGIGELLNARLYETLKGLRDESRENWTLLPGFVFSSHEVASHTRLPIDNVRAFIDAFTLPATERNRGFNALSQFNVASAYPFLRWDADEFVALQYYSVSEALYDSPFYWMCADNAYATAASHNRGVFAESFAAERLSRVFGAGRVFRNVEVLASKKTTLGEIDVLAMLGNHAIVVQAKSKKLTLGARKGNDGLLRKDFQAAIQSAVDQSFACAMALCDGSVTLRTKEGRRVPINGQPQAVFPVALVAEHYPALSAQAHYFLKAPADDERIRPPLVTDVFALDVATDMLYSPIRFLSYLRFRARYSNRLLAGHERMLLGYYLKYGAEIGADADYVWLGEDFSLELDVAMAARREGIPGARTPQGILTAFEDTSLGRITADLEASPIRAALGLGFMLHDLKKDTAQKLNTQIDKVLNRTAVDGLDHDFSMKSIDMSRGLTIHCNDDPKHVAEAFLRGHCEFRKYAEKADSWFGLAIRPDGSVRAVVELIGKWSRSAAGEAMLEEWSAVQSRGPKRGSRIGRNAPCPCGSGKKYKHCCIDR